MCLWEPSQRTSRARKWASVTISRVGFTEGAPHMHWSKSTLIVRQDAATFTRALVDQIRLNKGFSTEKSLPNKQRAQHASAVRSTNKLPKNVTEKRSRSRLGSPSGNSADRSGGGPPSSFLAEEKVLQGVPKCMNKIAPSRINCMMKSQNIASTTSAGSVTSSETMMSIGGRQGMPIDRRIAVKRAVPEKTSRNHGPSLATRRGSLGTSFHESHVGRSPTLTFWASAGSSFVTIGVDPIELSGDVQGSRRKLRTHSVISVPRVSLATFHTHMSILAGITKAAPKRAVKEGAPLLPRVLEWCDLGPLCSWYPSIPCGLLWPSGCLLGVQDLFGTG